MEIIQSYFSNLSNNIRSNISLVASQSLVSCKFLKKHKYTVVLYTSPDLKDSFKENPYDDIICIDEDEYKDIIKNNFWSGTKLVSCCKHERPYVHIDIDLFLIENILADKINTGLITLHIEPWIKNILKVDHALYSKIYNTQTSELDSYNCAVFGGSDTQIINNAIKRTISTTINNLDTFDSGLVNHINTPDSSWVKSVFIEQMVLIDSIPIPPTTLIDTFHCKNFWDVFSVLKQSNIIHLWMLKSCVSQSIGVDRLMALMNNYYF
jgi:hypothetical protein